MPLSSLWLCRKQILPLCLSELDLELKKLLGNIWETRKAFLLLQEGQQCLESLSALGGGQDTTVLGRIRQL